MFALFIEMFLLSEEGIALEEILTYALNSLKDGFKESVKKSLPFYNIRKDVNDFKKEIKEYKKLGAKNYIKDKATPKWWEDIKDWLFADVERITLDEGADLGLQLGPKFTIEGFRKILPFYLKGYAQNFYNVAMYVELKERKQQRLDKNKLNEYFKNRERQDKKELKDRQKEAKKLSDQGMKEAKMLQKQAVRIIGQMEKLIRDIFYDSGISNDKKVELYYNFSSENDEFKKLLSVFINTILLTNTSQPTIKIKAIWIANSLPYGYDSQISNFAYFTVKSPQTGNFSIAPLKYDRKKLEMTITIRGGGSRGKRIIKPYTYFIPIELLERAMRERDYGKNFFWRYTPPSNTIKMPKYKSKYKNNIDKYNIKSKAIKKE